MLTDFYHLARLEAQGYNLANGVAGEGDVPRSLRLGNEDLQAREKAFRQTPQ